MSSDVKARAGAKKTREEPRDNGHQVQLWVQNVVKGLRWRSPSERSSMLNIVLNHLYNELSKGVTLFHDPTFSAQERTRRDSSKT